MLRRMLDMIVHKRRNRVVAMIMPLIVPDVQVLVITSLSRRSRKVLGKQLPLLIEVVARSLQRTRSEIGSKREKES